MGRWRAVDIAVIEDPAAAAIALDPMRSRLLSELVEPSSAGALALRLGIPRQKLNYHLRALEAHGLLELAEERKRGGITERVLRATAVSYVVSPAALGESAADPDLTADHLSARYMVALAGRLDPRGGQPGPPRRRRREAAAHDGDRHRDRLPLGGRPCRLRR